MCRIMLKVLKSEFFPRKYVLLQGGLGNQLWQLAFAHKLARNSSVKLVYISNLLTSNSHLERGVEVLKRVLEKCKHRIQIEEHDFRNPCSRLRFVPESKYAKLFGNPSQFLDSSNFSSEELIRMDCTQVTKFIGFFQSLNFISNEVSSVLIELEDSFHSDSLPTKFQDFSYNVFIHVRGGDYLHAKHRNTLGLLSSEYYRKLREILDLELRKDFVVFSDDPSRVEDLFPNLADNQILAQENFNEFESLFLMSRASTACIANSTFSWWGGKLAQERGGRLIAPYPWSKKEEVDGEYTSDVYDEYTERIKSSFQ